MPIDHTHDPEVRCWVAGAEGHPEFPIQNLPLGIFIPPSGGQPRIGTAIGDAIFDISAAEDILGNLTAKVREALQRDTLNDLLALGNDAVRELRLVLFAALSGERSQPALRENLHRRAGCRLLLPATIYDYTDFYTGIHHAENIGRMFRPDNPLLPNYKFVPIGYHGRSSSIRPSGVDVIRPRGQIKPPGANEPIYAPSQRLDYELEMGVWIGAGNALGTPIPISSAPEHIAGLSILNDWSARDHQAWEYQPLGPFLAKNFHTTISPWIVTSAALAPYRTAQPARDAGDPAPLPYLLSSADQRGGAYAISMDVFIQTQAMREQRLAPHQLSHGSMTAMYWTSAQMVTHHTANGCNLGTGDLLGTGTLSGASADSFGSLMEISRGGSSPIALANGERRAFLEDGDEIIIAAYAEAPGYARIGFGECRAIILKAET